MGQLGCASRYDAIVHWQGGRHQFARLDAVTQVTWGRKINDYSEASITLAKRELSSECWQHISPTYHPDGTLSRPGIEPWAHELSIYRDRALVWQGPIVEWTETRTEIEIEARDVLAWMDRRVVDLNLEAPPGEQQKYRGRTGDVVRAIFARTWPGTHETNPWDNPGISEHARIDVVDDRWTETESIWKGSRTVGDLVRDVCTNGTDFFTLGRKVYVLPDYRASDLSRAPYRLHEEHLLAEIEIRKLGLELATEGFVAASPENSSTNAPPVYGKWPPQEGAGGPDNLCTPAWYGRITRFHEPSSLGGTVGPENPSPALQQVARAINEYGWPCPMAIVLPNEAGLSPQAPVEMNQLIPGRVFSIEVDTYVNKVQDLFRLNEIEVTWNRSSDQSRTASGQFTANGARGPEQVSIALVTLRTPPIPTDGNTNT